MEAPRSHIAEAMMNKKNNATPDLKISYRAIAIKPVQYWQKTDIRTDEQNRRP